MRLSQTRRIWFSKGGAGPSGNDGQSGPEVSNDKSIHSSAGKAGHVKEDVANRQVYYTLGRQAGSKLTPALHVLQVL